jgi:hypothetical protein
MSIKDDVRSAVDAIAAAAELKARAVQAERERNEAKRSLAAIDAAWDGVMVAYTEYDVPGGPGRERSVPGWRCKSCGREVGTSGLPPRACHCRTYG